MNNKEKRNIEINYGFVLIAFAFGIICNLFANQFENLLDFMDVNWYIIIFCIICFIYMHFDFSKKLKTEYGHPATEKIKFLIRCRAVIVCEDKILAVKHFEGVDYYALPGGHMDKGEDPMICVKREVKEEFGIDIDLPALKYIYKWIDNDGTENVEFIFLIKDGSEFNNLENNTGSHAFEIFESRWVGKDESLNVYPSQVPKDFKENNFEFEGIKFISQ